MPHSPSVLQRACLSIVLAVSACALSVAPAGAGAHPVKRRAAVHSGDVAAQFSALASQQPWTCRSQQATNIPPAWTGGVAQCAWQERLQMRRWHLTGGAPAGQCLSAQATWWAWARASKRLAAANPVAWDSSWTSQLLVDEAEAVKRLLLIERMADGAWRATEWRWLPSPRSATRRWQQARWQLLKARTASLRQPAAPVQGGREARMLRQSVLANVRTRAAQVNGNVVHYQADGQCLQIDAAAPGQQMLQVPYLAEDSRLEQRAAMQLQLARRYPKAVWLTPFTLIPARRDVRSGAKFYALWREGTVLNGQLWMPTRSDGPLVRARITTVLAAAAEAAAVAQAQQTVTAELMALAAWWTVHYE